MIGLNFSLIDAVLLNTYGSLTLERIFRIPRAV
jgi:hypothetical protein